MTETLEYPVLDQIQASIPAPAPASTISTALALLVKTNVAEFTLTESGLIDLHHRLHGIAYTGLATVKGMDAAVADKRELRDLRVGLGKMAKEFNTTDREGYEARRDARNAGCVKLTEIALALENPISEQIEAELSRKAAIKAEKDRVEAARVLGYQTAIAAIRNYTVLAAGKDSEAISRGIKALVSMTFTADKWEEFAPLAGVACNETVNLLGDMLVVAKAAEVAAVEQVRVQAEQARIREEQKAEAKQLAAAKAEFIRLQLVAAELIAKQQAEIDAQKAALEAAANPPAPAPAVPAAAPAPAPQPVAPVAVAPHVPVPVPAGYCRAQAKLEVVKLVDMTPAERMTEWVLFEDSIQHVIPTLETHAQSIDYRRFCAALDRMRAVFA